MATEVQKSIQISYKADLKDLMEKLKQIPNVTDQEAKKMVAALDRQLKQAESAAKKSAEASKKAAQEAGKAASRGAKDFDDMADSAREAEERLENVGEASGDIDRGFSSMGLALREVNPELADAADGIADAFAVTEGLTMSFAALNPLVLAGAGLVAGLAVAYTVYSSEVEAARIKSEEIKEEIEKVNKKIQEQKGIVESMNSTFANLTSQVNESGLQLALARGEITKFDAASMKATQTANNFRMQSETTFKTQKEALDASIKARKSEIKLMWMQIRPLQSQRAIQQSLTERIAGLPQQFKAMTEEEELLRAKTDILKEQLKIDEAKVVELVKEKSLIAQQSKQLEANLQGIVRAEEAAAKNKKRSVKSSEKIVEVQEVEVDNLRNLIELDQKRFQAQQSASNALQKLTEEQGLSDPELAELNFQRELERIAELGEVSQQQAEAKDLMNAKIAEREKDSIKELNKLKSDAFQKDMDNAQSLFSALGEFTNAAMGLLKAKGREDSKAAKILFNMSKAAALGDIAFESAKQIMAATALPPGFRGAKIGLVLATAAAQTGLVMAQQPPQASFHMGGMAPDEMNSRVLQGEAVLDRATVQRIGGEEGVQQLQQGGGMDNQVVVIQPFRHFGRFAREIGFRPQKQTGIRAY
jgi:chromosome segregation ATPase